MPIINTVINGRAVQFKARPFAVHERPIVAIDPDAERHGVSLVVRGELVTVESLETLDLYDRLAVWKDKNPLVLLEYIDDNKGTFRRAGDKNEAIRKSIAQKVGKAKHAQSELVKICKKLGLDYGLVPPLRTAEKKYAKDGKGAARFFLDLTGWQGRTNADNRDAAIIGLYGLPERFAICDRKHVYTGPYCRTCEAEDRSKERSRRRRSLANAAKALL